MILYLRKIDKYLIQYLTKIIIIKYYIQNQIHSKISGVKYVIIISIPALLKLLIYSITTDFLSIA